MKRLISLFIPHTRIRYPYPNQRFHLWLDVGAVCVSSARTDLCRRNTTCFLIRALRRLVIWTLSAAFLTIRKALC
jgi:hypothetical protein